MPELTMVIDHKWRPFYGSGVPVRLADVDRPCAYLNCGRPPAEHAQAVRGGPGGPPRKAAS